MLCSPVYQTLGVSNIQHFKIQAVAIDISPPAFFSAVVKNLPETALVCDHFHVIKMFNDKLSKLRRALFNEATDKLHENILKRTY